jgi:hypothetical protein
MNLISAEMRSSIESAMGDIFDTFARDNQVTFYKVASETVVVHDPNYNSDFDEIADFSSVVKTAQSQAFTCRIWYLDRQEHEAFISGGDDPGIRGKFYYNRIRLQFKEDAFNYLKATEKFVFGDEQYIIEEGWQKIGILGSFQFYEIVIRRVN